MGDSDIYNSQPILPEEVQTRIQLLHGANSTTTLDFTTYQYFSDDSLSQELDLLALEPHLYGLTPDPLDILQDHTSVNIHRTASQRKYTADEEESMRRCLGWISEPSLRRTLDHTTLLAKNHMRIPMRRHFRSREPVLNRHRLGEVYATDTFFAESSAVDGTTCAQLFTGCKSFFTKALGMKSENEAPTALEDFCRNVGVPTGIRSDNSKAQTSKRWKDICRRFCIGQTTTEPHHPQQNPAERRIKTVKQLTLRLLDRSGAPRKM